MTRSIRKHLAAKQVGATAGFRWRGGKEISRLEGLSDAVFAFAITLLVVSLEVPHTFAELKDKMHGFLAFGICFALLFTIWYEQYVFFRRYGLEDMTVVCLNALLIFVVLFYVYPLKFLFGILVDQLLGVPVTGIRTQAEMAQLMVIFSAGFVAVFAIFAVLYAHAYRHRTELELNEVEISDTRQSIWSSVTQILVGIASLLIIAAAGPRGSGWAGVIYMTLGPVKTFEGMFWGRRRRILEERHGATRA